MSDGFSTEFYHMFKVDFTLLISNYLTNRRNIIKFILSGHRIIQPKKRITDQISFWAQIQKYSINTYKQSLRSYQNITHHDQVNNIQEMQGWFNMWKSVNVIYHINNLKEKHHMYISLDTENTFDKIQH